MSLQTVLLLVLLILAALVVGGLLGGLVVLARHGARETQEEPSPAAEAPPPPPPAEPEPRPQPLYPKVTVAAPLSPTQTPDDVDERSPAELAAAAQAAEAAEAAEAQVPPPPAPAGLVGAPQAPAPKPPPDPARLRLLGLTLGMLTERMRREHPAQLGTALARVAGTDQEAARAQLSTLALSLLGEDQEASAGDGQLSAFLEESLAHEVQRGFSFSSMPEFQQALSGISPQLREKLQTIVWAGNADSVTILDAGDVEALERVAVAVATALVLDTSYDLRRPSGDDPPGDA